MYRPYRGQYWGSEIASFVTEIQEIEYVIIYDRSARNTILSFETSMLKRKGRVRQEEKACTMNTYIYIYIYIYIMPRDRKRKQWLRSD